MVLHCMCNFNDKIGINRYRAGMLLDFLKHISLKTIDFLLMKRKM